MVREMDKTVTAVLISAGLDSTVLAAKEALTSIVQPLYISTGLAWEKAELKVLTTILNSQPLAHAQPLVNLFLSVSDLYPPTHWAISGNPPDFDTPDEDVYQPVVISFCLAKQLSIVLSMVSNELRLDRWQEIRSLTQRLNSFMLLLTLSHWHSLQRFKLPHPLPQYTSLMLFD